MPDIRYQQVFNMKIKEEKQRNISFSRNKRPVGLLPDARSKEEVIR